MPEKKIKTVGSRASVYHGNAKKTSGGLTKGDLRLNSQGKLVSKKNSTRAKREESPMLKMWRQSVSTVYKQPRYKGRFVPLKKGSAFYKAVKAEYVMRLKRAGYDGTTPRKRRTRKRRTY